MVAATTERAFDVYVKRPTGKRVVVTAAPGDTAGDVRRAARLGHLPGGLAVEGGDQAADARRRVVVPDDAVLASAAGHGARLAAAAAAPRRLNAAFFAPPSAEGYAFAVRDAAALALPVRDLVAQHVAPRLGLPAEELRLVLGCIELSPDGTLWDYDVESGETLQVLRVVAPQAEEEEEERRDAAVTDFDEIE